MGGRSGWPQPRWLEQVGRYHGYLFWLHRSVQVGRPTLTACPALGYRSALQPAVRSSQIRGLIKQSRRVAQFVVATTAKVVPLPTGMSVMSRLAEEVQTC